MPKKLIFSLTLFILMIIMPLGIYASDTAVLAFSSTGYDGDEIQTFYPTPTSSLSRFTLDEDSWYFYGLSTSSGLRERNGIPFVYTVVGKPDSSSADTQNKTELMLDLSAEGYNLTGFSTLYFGISIVGDNDIKYTVSAELYSSSGNTVSSASVGVGWNLYSMDIRKITGTASHLLITVSYDEEIPASIRITPPYISQNTNTSFISADKYMTLSLNAEEGICIQKSGRIKPDDSSKKAVLSASFAVIDTSVFDASDDKLYFDIEVSGIISGSVTLTLYGDNGAEISQSKKISLSGSVGSFVLPMTLNTTPSSYTLTFDNIECDVFFTLNSVKTRRFDTVPYQAESGIGQLSKITKTSEGITFSGGMERSAISEYSRLSDEMIHFYSLPAEHMDDIAYAEEIGSIKFTTIFEFTADITDSDGMMFFAGIYAQDETVIPFSTPRFPDAVQAVYHSDDTSLIGLYNPTPVGAFESNTSAVMTEIQLEDILADANSEMTLSVHYSDNVIEFDRDKISELDSSIEFYNTAGVRVYIRLKSTSSDTSLIYAAVKFFSARYPSVYGFAVGSDIDLSSTMSTYANGNDEYELENYAADLALFFRNIYDASYVVDGTSKVVIIPIADTGSSLSVVTLTTLLTSRLAEIGKIPFVLMSDYDIASENAAGGAENAVQIIGELECGTVDGIVYLCTPSNADISASRASSDDGLNMPFAEYAAQMFISAASSLSGNRIKCVFFSLDNTSLKNSRDFYSVLKQSDEATGHVYDSEAIRADLQTDIQNNNGGTDAVYSLYDFTDKFYADGWIAGGGVESCISSESSVSGSRVLKVDFKHDENSSASGSAGITLCNFSHSIDFTDVSSVEFTISLTDNTSDDVTSSVVFVIGNSITRAEYYIENLDYGTEYTLSCPLGGYETRGETDYIGIMLYSDTNVTLELSSVSIRSDVLDENGMAALFSDTSPSAAQDVNYRLIALFLGVIAAISIAVFVLLTKLEREGSDDEQEKNKDRYTYDYRGAANEKKYKRR